MKNSILSSATVIALFGLAACGGGGGGGAGDATGGTTTTASADGTIALAGALPGGVTPTLVGVASLNDGSGDLGNNVLSRVVGVSAGSGALTLADNRSSFSGQAGFDANGVQYDGLSQISEFQTNGTYNATLFSGARIGIPGVANYGVTYAIIGPAVDPAALPASGSVIYAGEADMIHTIDFATNQYNNGQADVTVDFDASTVDVVMSNFDAGGAATYWETPFDTIAIQGMNIASDGSFSGGTLSASEAGAPIPLSALLQGATSVSAGGSLMGPVTSGRPAEVGGVLAASGATDGALSAVFIAR